MFRLNHECKITCLYNFVNFKTNNKKMETNFVISITFILYIYGVSNKKGKKTNEHPL